MNEKVTSIVTIRFHKIKTDNVYVRFNRKPICGKMNAKAAFIWRGKHAEFELWYNIDRYYTAPSEASVHREAHTMCKAHGIISTDIIPRRFASDQRENKLFVKMRSHIQSLEQEILILKQ